MTKTKSPSDTEHQPIAIINPKSITKVGEPYDLLGKQLVFTNWYYVRPGTFRWRDAGGNGLSLSASVNPGRANFHQMDAPRGIRLRTQAAKHPAPLGVEKDKPMTLRFRMRSAKLFSLEVK